MNLTKLNDWVAKGLISKQQADQIMFYEDQQPQKSWMLIGFMILGAITLCLGIVSLIAANWQNIPNNIKLITNFTVLTILAVMIFMSYRSKNILRFDLLLLSFILLCLASIGLIGQVFHTTSESYIVALFWSAITFVAITTTQRTLIWIIWLTALIYGVFYGATDTKLIYELFNSAMNQIATCLTFLLIFAALLANKYSSNKGLIKALYICSFAMLLITLIGNELAYERYGSSVAVKDRYVNALVVISLGLVSIGIITNSEFKIPQKIIMHIILVLTFLSGITANLNIESQILHAVISISIGCLVAILAASWHKKHFFHLCLALIFIRIMILYFQALGGLAATGTGLMIAGVLIIYFAVLWKKHSNWLLLKIEGWTNATH